MSHSSQTVRLGLLADTHVPYRSPSLPPVVLDALRGVDLILHAGDVDEPWALAPLREIAPVHAVRGNYHIVERSNAGASLPLTVTLRVAGLQIVLVHGHRFASLPVVWWWKVRSVFQHLRHRWDYPAYERTIIRGLLRQYGQADILVFGHTHRFYLARWGKTLVINPGAALNTAYFNAPFLPSVVHLILTPGKAPQAIRIPVHLAAPSAAATTAGPIRRFRR